MPATIWGILDSVLMTIPARTITFTVEYGDFKISTPGKVRYFSGPVFIDIQQRAFRAQKEAFFIKWAPPAILLQPTVDTRMTVTVRRDGTVVMEETVESIFVEFLTTAYRIGMSVFPPPVIGPYGLAKEETESIEKRVLGGQR